MALSLETKISIDEMRSFYRQMVLIRRFEEKVVEFSKKGLVSGSTHPCIAQEATAVGAVRALQKGDQILATYRGHGQFLAAGADPKRAMAEILCRETGYCKGKGGSMHLSEPEIGFLGTNAIVAAHLPIAAGVALANKLRGDHHVTLCFFGDGASCEGVFYETLNLAALWKVPLVMVCENNGYAISVPVEKSLSVDAVSTRAGGFGLAGITIDGNDVVAVYDATREAADRARRGEGPTLIECKTVRWERHSALSAGYYKTPEDRKQWERVDPIPRFRAFLLENVGLDAAELDRLDAAAAEMAEEAGDFALQSPPTSEAELEKDIFA